GRCGRRGGGGPLAGGRPAGGANEGGPGGSRLPARRDRSPRRARLRLEDRVEPLRGRRLAQLLEGAGLELAHALPREAERLPDLLVRVLLLAAQAVAQAQDELLAVGQARDQRADARAHAVGVDAAVGRD